MEFFFYFSFEMLSKKKKRKEREDSRKEIIDRTRNYPPRKSAPSSDQKVEQPFKRNYTEYIQASQPIADLEPILPTRSKGKFMHKNRNF